MFTLPKGTFEALRTNVPTGNNSKKHYKWNNGITDSRYFDYHADKPEDRKYLNFAGLDWEIFLSNANPAQIQYMRVYQVQVKVDYISIDMV